MGNCIIVTASKSLILTAHQPVYLPWLGLFHKIAMADLLISLNQVQYLRSDWNNRNKINTATGPIWLSVPVLHKGRFEKKYCDIQINNTLPWARKHWTAMKQNYGKAPYFAKYAGFFEDCYSRRWETLVQLNEYMLKWFLETLGVKTPCRLASDYDFQGKKASLLLDMCVKTGAGIFIFGAQGKNYADIDAFRQAGVEPVFQDYRHPQYPQTQPLFVPNLCIVDLLFNCGDESLGILMSGNIGRFALTKAGSQGLHETI